jgi:hypothetical protein
MAESLLGGGLGEEDEKPEGAAPKRQAGAQAFAAAIAAIASREDPPGHSNAARGLIVENRRCVARRGRRKEALTKYDAALKYAPTWTPLIEARSAVANQKQ